MGAEFAGTFGLVVVGPGTAAALATDHSSAALASIAAAFGAVVALSIIAFGRTSGSHINPAVTVAQAVRDQQFDRTAAFYILTQMGAGLAAGALLALLFPADASSAHLGSTSLATGVSQAMGLAFEVGGTFVLASAALRVNRVFRSNLGQGATIGATLFVLIMLITPFTGASFNPSRSAGPAVAAGYLDNLWVYIVGPLTGGALAGVAARLPWLKGTAASP